MSDFQEMRDDLESEMDSRFKHQDELVGNTREFRGQFDPSLSNQNIVETHSNIAENTLLLLFAVRAMIS